MTVYSAVAADSLFRPSPSPLQTLQIIMKEYNLLSGFPNVCIALAGYIHLTLPVSNCSGEISFSHLSFFRPSPSPLQMLQIIMKASNFCYQDFRMFALLWVYILHFLCLTAAVKYHLVT